MPVTRTVSRDMGTVILDDFQLKWLGVLAD